MGTKVRWSTDNHQWHEDSSENVSTTGMMLRTKNPATVGATIKLTFKLPNLSFQDPIQAEAEVMRMVERHGQQIGIGLRFMSLRSKNYQVVEEFVCRIMGLPLADDMAQMGSRNAAGYCVEMEQLLRKAEERNVAAAERKLAKERTQQRRAGTRIWTRRGIRIGMILLCLFVAIKAAGFFMAVFDTVKNGPQ